VPKLGCLYISVLGADGGRRPENGPLARVPPPRVEIDGNVMELAATWPGGGRPG
jgi:hypothetical protein